MAVVGTIQFQDIDDLFAMTGRFRNLKKELDYYKTELNKQLGARYSFEHIVGRDEQLERVKELARKVARSDTTVLLVGESGTGKELFAHAIHVESGRALRPFLKVNCAAIPAELFESELFGYKEGAFTGARARGKKGKFSLADGGTLFLDEISELPPAMQAKLLRVLQEREVEPVGRRAARGRSTSASWPPPTGGSSRCWSRGRSGTTSTTGSTWCELDIPPLRERRDDLPLLTEQILRQLERETGIPVEGLDDGAEAALRAHPWPGNVRELRNVLEQALYVKTGSVIDPGRPAAVAAGRGRRRRARGADGGRRLKDQLRAGRAGDPAPGARGRRRGPERGGAARLGISRSSIYAEARAARALTRRSLSGRPWTGFVVQVAGLAVAASGAERQPIRDASDRIARSSVRARPDFWTGHRRGATPGTGLRTRLLAVALVILGRFHLAWPLLSWSVGMFAIAMFAARDGSDFASARSAG